MASSASLIVVILRLHAACIQCRSTRGQWSERRDRHGHRYWYNPVTNQSSWLNPDLFIYSPSSSPAKVGRLQVYTCIHRSTDCMPMHACTRTSSCGPSHTCAGPPCSWAPSPPAGSCELAPLHFARLPVHSHHPEASGAMAVARHTPQGPHLRRRDCPVWICQPQRWGARPRRRQLARTQSNLPAEWPQAR